MASLFEDPDEIVNTTRNPFRAGAAIYINDAGAGIETLTRLAARTMSQHFVGTLRRKLEYQPTRTGRVYYDHPTYGRYTASKAGEGHGIDAEYPAWYTGALRKSIQGKITTVAGSSSYTVGSDVPHARWLTRGREPNEDGKGAMSSRNFLLRNAVEEQDAMEQIAMEIFRSLGKNKPKGLTQRSVTEQLLVDLGWQSEIRRALTWGERRELLQSDISNLVDGEPQTAFGKALQISVKRYGL